MFLKNYWYVAAFSNEVGRDPFPRRILDEPVVIWRTEDGRAVAFEDQCCHRQAPLSLGRTVGDCLQCGYHGMMYGADGQCVGVPGQTSIPPDARVRTYPLEERWDFLWIWMGDPERADPDETPNCIFNTADDWACVDGYLHLECHYQLLVDNLLDLTHETFLHAKTIGNEHVADTPLAKVQANNKAALSVSPLQRAVGANKSVSATRWMLDIDPPPLYTKSGGFEGRKVDRWQLLHFEPPSHVWLDAGVATAGTGAPDGDRKEGVTHILYDGITPETARSTHYFWTFPRDYKLDDAEIDELLGTGIQNTFLEDKEMLEKQQALMDAYPDYRKVDINADAPATQARRLVDRLLKAEAA